MRSCGRPKSSVPIVVCIGSLNINWYVWLLRNLFFICIMITHTLFFCKRKPVTHDMCPQGPGSRDVVTKPRGQRDKESLGVEAVASTFIMCAASFGLQVQFADGKTEALLQMVGEGAREALETLHLLEAEDGVPLLPLSGGGAIRIVPVYKHLGTMLAVKSAMTREVAHRVRAASAATYSLARPVLAKKDYGPSDRLMVAKACVHTRLLYQAATWSELSVTNFKKLRAAYDKPLRWIAGVAGPPLLGFAHTSSAAVHRELRSLPLEWALVLARLRFVARLASATSRAVRALVQSEGALPWRMQTQACLAVMWKVMQPHLAELPDPRINMAKWEALWAASPGGWKALIRKFEKTVLGDVVRFAPVLLEIQGLGFPVLVEDEWDEDPDEFLCGVCDAARSSQLLSTQFCGQVVPLELFFDAVGLGLGHHAPVVNRACGAW